jgi:glycosyltransferase involved in cell wall biosynthesis
MRIDVLANDGSPLGVSEASINGEDGRMGVGGAELAILTLMAGWADAGHDVTFYNDPQHNHKSRFRHAPMSLFSPRESRDILIVFRSPNRRAENANGKKIWFSTDQYTVGGFAEFAQHVDKIVTISPFHAEYFRDTYQIENTTTIDLPVRTWEYNKIIPKVPHRMIFCSVPDRGLAVLADGYDYIKQHVPDASLVITSDYRLWGASSPMNEKYLRRFMGKPDVVFLGAVGRPKMIEEQLMAEVHAYPSTYPELFCYAVAECQMAGALPVTSTIGAIRTTNMGIQVDGDPFDPHWVRTYADVVISTLLDTEIRNKQDDVKRLANSRFSLDRILSEWDKVFSDG